MDMTIHHTDEIRLIRHNKLDGRTILTTLVIKHRDGEFQVDLFSDQPITFLIGESDD